MVSSLHRPPRMGKETGGQAASCLTPKGVHNAPKHIAASFSCFLPFRSYVVRYFHVNRHPPSKGQLETSPTVHSLEISHLPMELSKTARAYHRLVSTTCFRSPSSEARVLSPIPPSLLRP